MKSKAERIIYLVDMQSFYASVEKAAHPEYRDKPLIVAGDPARRSGIVLAACPIAKKFGVTTAEWVGEAVRKCPGAVVVRPHMQQYIDVSLHISEILERFSDLVEPYSIDEQFMDVTRSYTLFGKDPAEVARQVQAAIRRETGVFARIGIGPNKVLAKMACDNFAKKNEDGIFILTHENKRDMLWPLAVDKMFGVGSRMNRHLRRLGIHTIGDLANYPIERLKRVWGVNGHVLWMTANGYDHSPVTPTTYDQQKGIGHQMTLPRDYRTFEDISVVLLELSEEVCRRARSKKLMGETVTVGCRGADFDRPSGFLRQTKLSEPTNHAPHIFAAARQLFARHWNGEPVRSVGVSLTQLRPDDEYQLDLFRDRERERRLDNAVDAIKERYGAAAIVRASSLTAAGQAYERAKKIGGHYK
jgi:nucleotidyltransferase/DNA polymerase involved in DNA repair